MKRRDFLGIAASSIFAPKFGKWYTQGSGLVVRDEGLWKPDLIPSEAAFVDYVQLVQRDLAARFRQSVDEMYLGGSPELVVRPMGAPLPKAVVHAGLFHVQR